MLCELLALMHKNQMHTKDDAMMYAKEDAMMYAKEDTMMHTKEDAMRTPHLDHDNLVIMQLQLNKLLVVGAVARG